jgi:hypothetical protein
MKKDARSVLSSHRFRETKPGGPMGDRRNSISPESGKCNNLSGYYNDMHGCQRQALFTRLVHAVYTKTFQQQ